MTDTTKCHARMTSHIFPRINLSITSKNPLFYNENIRYNNTRSSDMEPQKSEAPKIPDMVMCGDHSSFTKTDLNMKETKIEDKEKEKPKEEAPISQTRISPSSCSHAASELAQHRARSLEVVPRPHVDVSAAPPNRTLVHVALGSFRWPPYLVAVWVLVLVMTHVLHSLVSVLERALPAIKKFCQYFRTWTEESWKTDTEINHRIYPFVLACATGILYVIYCSLYLVYSIAIWSIEPLCTEVNEDRSTPKVDEVKVTNYIEDVLSSTISGTKQ